MICDSTTPPTSFPTASMVPMGYWASRSVWDGSVRMGDSCGMNPPGGGRAGLTPGIERDIRHHPGGIPGRRPVCVARLRGGECPASSRGGAEQAREDGPVGVGPVESTVVMDGDLRILAAWGQGHSRNLPGAVLD